MKLKIREQTNRKIELSDWEIINKVYRRLYTCSYKIKNEQCSHERSI